MSRQNGLRSMIGVVSLWAGIAGLGGGVAAAQTPQLPVTIQVYNGSSTPVDIMVEPWAAVFLDDRPVTLAALRPGVVADVVIDSQGQATEVLASDRTVSGVVSTVRTANNGHLYLVIAGRSYEVRRSSAVVASGGSVIGSLMGDQSLLTDNEVIAHLGPGGRVGYVEIG